MKHTLLLSVLSIGLLSGCSTAFKSGQTPDDVYYSPGRNREETTQKEEQTQKKAKEEYEQYVTPQRCKACYRKSKNGLWKPRYQIQQCRIYKSV